MPFYCFTSEDGETRTERFAMDEVPAMIRFPDGKLGKRDIVAEHRPLKERRCQRGWPIHPFALGVHPSQVKTAESFYRRKGCPIHFSKKGIPEIPNESVYKKVRKASGFVQRNSYYGS